ncbi:hypothetical protein Btru_029582, partial [Bulinus truncatus]
DTHVSFPAVDFSISSEFVAVHYLLIPRMFYITVVTLAVFLIFVSQGFSQVDYIMLLENCGWESYYDVSIRSLNLTSPNRTLSANLVCKTSFILKVPPPWDTNKYTLKVKVFHFDLNGPDSCIPYSERLSLQLHNGDYPKIVWCGKTFSEEMIFPAMSAPIEVIVVYSVGHYGLGSGFTLEFSKVYSSNWYSGQEQKVSASPKLLYSPYYPFDYSSFESFFVTLRAPPNSSVHVSSLDMNSDTCDDYPDRPFTIDGAAHCASGRLDLFIYSSSVPIELRASFVTERRRSFVLKYSSFVLESLNCTKNESYLISVDDQEKLLNINIINSLLTRCVIQISTLSDDKVVKLKLPTWNNFQIYENNAAVNISNVQYFQSQGKVVTILIFPLMNADLSTVSWNATAQAVNKGPDSSYFELTKDCNGSPLTGMDIFSLNSTVVSMGLRSDLTEFQMLIYLRDPSLVKVPNTPILQNSTSGYYAFNKSLGNARNLYCQWEIQTRKDLPLIQVKARSNFQASSSSTMHVYQGFQDSVLAIYDKFSPVGAGWLLSLTPLQIDVSIPDSDSPDFSFTYVYSNTTGFTNSCGDQYLTASSFQQWASTPNFPNIYPSNDSCQWIIRKNSIHFGSKIALDFADLSGILCQDVANLTVSADSHGIIRLCDISTFSQSYKDDLVTVQLSSSTMIKPGIRFAYKQEEPAKVTCQTNFTMAEDTVYSLVYSGSSTMIEDCIYYLYPTSYDSSITLSVNVDFMFTNTMDVYVQQPQAGAANMWVPALRLDHVNYRKGNYTFEKSSPLKISVTWDYTPTIFLINAFISRKSCSYVELIATSTYGYLSSPYYPEHYQYDSVCQWHITADQGYIVLEFMDFLSDDSSKCSVTRLEIYAGSLANRSQIYSISSLPKSPLVTHSYELTLKYKSFYCGKNRGFKLKYYTFSESTTSPTTVAQADELSTSPAMIIGSVVACAIIVAILIAGILYSIRRRKLNRALQERTTVNYNRRTSAVYIFNPVIINNIPPPPYPGVESMGVPPPYSESARSDEYSTFELPPPYYAVGEESNVRSAGVNVSVTNTSGEHVFQPAEDSLTENVYNEIGDSASNVMTTTTPGSCPNAAFSASPAEHRPSQMTTAFNPGRPQRHHGRGNHSLGEL